jgi:hypothetical protein
LREEKVRLPKFISVACLVLIGAIAPAHADNRVALVIGNDRYANLPANEQLHKAVNDAHAVGGALRQIGFDVIEGENLGRQAVLAQIDEASQRFIAGDRVFFFFSGHGVTVDGCNYILPADAPAVGTAPSRAPDQDTPPIEVADTRTLKAKRPPREPLEAGIGG